MEEIPKSGTTVISASYRCVGILDSDENREYKEEYPDEYEEMVNDGREFEELGLITRKQIRELELKYEYNVWLVFDWHQEIVKTEY